ncbi:MAG TPA: ABC transporter transmembrane domain-containing protein, partial [Dehalococcoidia bacterium]|nr:ABC transporter transmembrane domain-containing protein [Dehalococcoidia bacterium]
ELVWTHRRRLALGLALMLINRLAGLVLPTTTKYLMDDVITQGHWDLLPKLAFAAGGATLVDAAAAFANSQVLGVAAQRAITEMRKDVEAHVMRLPIGYFDSTKTGILISRIMTDAEGVRNLVGTGLVQLTGSILTAIIALGVLLYLNWKLTLMALVVLPLFFLTTKFLGPPAAKASRERQDQFGAVTGVLQENVAAQPVIRAYGLQNTFIREYMAAVQRLYQTAIRVVFLGSLFGLSATLLTTLIQVLVLGIGGYFVIQGQLTLGSLVAFLGLISGLIAPAQSMSGVAQALQQATGAMDRVNEVLNTEPKIADTPGAVPAGPLKEGITFENVTFSYTGAEPQLVDMNFTIPAGASVAFVGPSGSGKSTVTNLVSRFYDADRGRVLMDGRDVRDFQVDSLRRQIGLVSQDNFLFNRSVRENIRFGREGATDEEVEAAAKAAEVHDFIMAMPQGYDTPVGERGGNLSGGQRQRIAIARAILRNPSILILDEATSALDPRTENAINHTLASLAKGRTTISVTHRLAAAATADRIFVLDRGRLAEQGSHNELLAQGGLYARLYEEQSGAVPGGVLKLALEIEYLRRVPIFATLNGDQLSSLASRLTTERAEDGADVITAGETGDKLYLILSGEAAVIGRDVAGRERELTVLRAGDYFGEIALLYDTPRTATVRARSALTLYSLDREGFLSLLESVPGLRQTVEQAVAERHVSRGTERPAGAELSPAAAAPAVAVAQPEPARAAPGEQPAASLFAAPWTRQRPRLLLQDAAGNRRAITLNEQFTGIGRNPNNDIVLPDRRVSGFHARIERDAAGRFVLTDSGSTNGTRINGQPVTSAELRDGDVIQLGGTTLTYEQGA